MSTHLTSSRLTPTVLLFAALVPLAPPQLVAGLPATVPLVRGWTLQSSAEIRAGGEVVSLRTFKPSGWYPATAPSTVVGVQVAAGAFADPNFGMNLRHYPGMTYPIGLNSFNNLPMDKASPYAVAWWYRTEFELPAEYAGRTVWLRFEGINYRANVWLNGRKLADSRDVAGAYRIHELDATDLLAAGVNVLAVEVFAPTEKDLAINWVDWNPTPPDKNMGLWGPVSLSASGPVSVRHPQVLTHLPGGSLQQADLTLMAQLHNATRTPVQGVLAASFDNVRVEQDVKLLPGETRSVRFAPERFPQLRVKQPRLWWPAEMGVPELHDLTMTFAAAGALSDGQRVRFGIREVTSELTDQGYRVFRINGQRLLVRGAAWTMDILLRPPTRERLEAELQYVLDMNLNTLRLEGQLGSDAFFDLADEKGILVMAGWCCCDIWEKWDEWPAGNLEVARESLRTEALRLRRHPSLLMWLNGSDGPPPAEVERAYLQVLEDAAWPNPILSSAADVPTSVSGPSGVKMTGPYDYEPPSYWLTANVGAGPRPPLDNARYGGAFGFNTETGPGPALPPLESLKKWLPPERLWPMNEVWAFHAAGERFMNLNRFNQALAATYGEPASLADFLRKSQAMVYDSERALFEAYSRNKYTATGVIHWKLNNGWPSIFWQLYDYYLYPAAGYFAVKKACEPLHVQYSYDDRSVVVVSSRRAPTAGLTVAAKVFDAELGQLLAREAKVDVAPDSSTRVLTLPPFPPEPRGAVYFLKLGLHDRTGREVSSNFYWLPATLSTIAWDKVPDTGFAPIATFEDLTALGRLPRVHLEATAAVAQIDGADAVRATVRNPSRDLAFQVHLGIRGAGAEEEILPVLWEDNYVCLMPGESRALTARYLKRGLLAQGATLVVDGWNIEPTTIPVRPGNAP